MLDDMEQALNLKFKETKGGEERGLTLYSLSDPDGEVAKRAKTLELRRRKAIEKLGERWVGKPVQRQEL